MTANPNRDKLNELRKKLMQATDFTPTGEDREEVRKMASTLSFSNASKRKMPETSASQTPIIEVTAELVDIDSAEIKQENSEELEVENLSDTRKKFLQYEVYLNKNFLSMNTVVKNLLAVQLTSRPLLLLGKPGTSKSSLAKLAASCYGDRDSEWFYDSLRPSSTVESIFGGMDAEEFLKGRTVLNLQDGAATKPIVILDEIFKVENPDLFGQLLPFFDEESTIKSGGKNLHTQLEWCILTSNELPDGNEFDALMNRINQICLVDDLEGLDRLAALDLASGKVGQSKPKMTFDDLKQARKEACQVKIPKDIKLLLVCDMAYEKLKEEAIKKGIAPLSIESSNCLIDKLKVKGIRVSQRQIHAFAREGTDKPSFLQAIAWLHGDSEVDETHLLWLVDSLWKVPDEKEVIEKVIKSFDQTNEINSDLSLCKKTIADYNEILDFSKATYTQLNEYVSNYNNGILSTISAIVRKHEKIDSKKPYKGKSKKAFVELLSLKKSCVEKIKNIRSLIEVVSGNEK